MSTESASKKLISPADGILILGMVFVCLLLFVFQALNQPDELRVVVEKHGEIVYEQKLSEDTDPFEYTVDNTAVVISVHGCTVAVVSSDCPDQTCVLTGTLQKAGDTAVCLPNQVVVRILGSRPAAVDGITG